MPVVPLNTISEPAHVRSPDLFVARPRMAEAMGAVSAAMGDRANAIGRNASILGQIADETGRQGEIRERTAYARLRGQQAMYQTIGNLGGQMMQAGIDLDRIEDHRAEEEANQALTQFTNTMNQRTTGYVDPDTQESVSGTYETPYSPATRDQPAQGPCVATAKAVREWYEDKQGPYANLSPRAKPKFDQKVGGVYQSLMAKASQLEYQKIQEYRQQNQKASIESRRNLLMNTWGGDTQNNAAFWTDAVANANELAAYGMEGMARNPDGTFVDAQAQEHYRNGIQDYLKMFATDRINTMLAKAQVEPDDSRRAAYLQSAIDTSTYKTGDQPFFNEQERAEWKLKTTTINTEALKAKLAATDAAFKEAEQEQVYVFNGKDPERFNQLRASLPPELNVILDQKAHAYAVAKDAFYTAQALKQFDVDLADPSTRARAAEKLDLFLASHLTTDEGRLDAKQKALQPHQKIDSENATIIASLGTRIDPATGQQVYLTDAQITDYLIANAGVAYDASKFDDLTKMAAERKPNFAVRDAIFQAIGQEIGASNLADSIKLEGGEFQLVKGDKSKIDPERVMGSITYSIHNRSLLTGRTSNQIVERKNRITARIVQQVAQAAYRYEQMPKITGKNGEAPPTLQEYIHSLLRPEENTLVRQLDEATMLEHIQNMEASTSFMRDAYFKKIWQNRYPAPTP